MKEVNGYHVPDPAAVASTVGSTAATPGAGVAAAPGLLSAPGGVRLKTAVPLNSFTDLRDDGSTACGAWIYSGIYRPTAKQPGGQNRAAERKGDDWVSPGWG